MPKAEGREVDTYKRTLAGSIVNEQIHITELLMNRFTLPRNMETDLCVRSQCH